MDEAILVGSFTLAGVLIAGLIDYLIRRGDRDAAERLRIQEQEARREERQATDRERWRDTGAPVWAKAREYLSDLHPDRIMLGRISPESVLEHAKDLERRWNEVREPLGTLAVGHPNERVRHLTDRTIVAVHGTWHWVLWMLTAYSMDRDWADFSKEARKEWEAATTLLHELREALHEAD